jgi:hypothetical protein
MITSATSTNGKKPTSEICVLADGRRIRFSLKRRPRDPYYLASFRGPDGLRKERSTKEPNKRRATDAAVSIIKTEFAPKLPEKPNPSWDEAIAMMKAYMEGDNLRPGTIQQYELVVGHLRRLYPDTYGPGDITPGTAQKFKVLRLVEKVLPVTVAGNVDNLSIVFGHWFCDVCKVLESNPFAGVEPPKYEKKPPRVISPEEETAFLTWLARKVGKWRLPFLFLEVKSLTGCRIGELAKAPSENLREGRLYFEAVTTKGRKQRAVKLPEALYDELKKLAGPAFVFEKFSQQLRSFYQKKGKNRYVPMVKDFGPGRLVNWLEDRVVGYLKANPKAKKFKLHNFRGTAMSKARMAGVSYDDAAIAFGCNSQTMRQHYMALDEVEISDRVMDKIQGRNGDGGNGHSPKGNNGRGTAAPQFGPISNS